MATITLVLDDGIYLFRDLEFANSHFGRGGALIKSECENQKAAEDCDHSESEISFHGLLFLCIK